MILTKLQPRSFQSEPLPDNSRLVGYSALISQFDIQAPLRSPMCVQNSFIRGNTSYISPWKVFEKRYWPGETLIDHLQFALKHEHFDLLILKRLFFKVPKKELQAAIQATPTGANMRRIWYLYELLTQQKLDIPNSKNAKYVFLLDPEDYYTGTANESRRHFIRDNLLGDFNFCPVVRKTHKLNTVFSGQWDKKAKEIVGKTSPQLIVRAASFMLLADSQASFAIEGEHPPKNRLERWSKTISQAGRFPLTIEEIERLHQILIGDSKLIKIGLRKEGVFLGERDVDNNPFPEFVGARPEDLRSMLNDLFHLNKKMQSANLNPILQATVIAFAFVYIHPLEDGNGRLHRYLLHHVLSEQKFSPPGMIFPVSAIMLEKIDDYKKILTQHSKPLMDYIEWETTPKRNVLVINDTQDLYRYFDATDATEFIADCIQQTIEHRLPKEIKHLKCHDRAVQDLMNYIEMPDQLAKKFILFVQQNQGKLSKNRHQAEFEDLNDQQIKDMELIVFKAFAEINEKN
ncbi:Fic family protein [bacterium]|nr:Fic family protein [bacterium]